MGHKGHVKGLKISVGVMGKLLMSFELKGGMFRPIFKKLF